MIQSADIGEEKLECDVCDLLQKAPSKSHKLTIAAGCNKLEDASIKRGIHFESFIIKRSCVLTGGHHLFDCFVNLQGVPHKYIQLLK